MPQVGLKLRESTSNVHHSLLYFCPGCKETHSVVVQAEEGPVWDFNGDYDKPTVSPSVRHFDADGTFCHYFIRDGKIEFCGDCEHELNGQTVDLPDWPYAPGTYGGIDE